MLSTIICHLIKSPNYRFMNSALIGTCFLILAACSGGGDSANTTKGTLIIPATVKVSKGNSMRIPIELSGSHGVKNQIIRLSVSDPEFAQVSPPHCVVSSGVNARCFVTITGKREGLVRILAESDGYDPVSTITTVGTSNGVGILQIGSTVGTSYYVNAANANYLVTVNFEAAIHSDIVITDENPLVVQFYDPSGYIAALPQQCNLTTKNPTCTFSGSWIPSQTLDTQYKNGITALIKVVGYWQQPGNAFDSQNYTPLQIQFTPTQNQVPGTISVASQNASNQLYPGMKAPLFVELNGSTLTKAHYQIQLTIPQSSQQYLAFYDYPSGTNTGPPKQTYTKTCNLNFDNSQVGSITGNLSCAYGLIGLANTPQSRSAAISVAVTQISATPSTSGLPSYNPTVNLLVGNAPAQKGRTITVTNNSSKAVVIGANSGTAQAYLGPGLLAGPGVTNCGAIQQCPIGSTCVQGGANPGGSYNCYWDAPAMPATPITPEGSAQITISGYSGITSGNQQIQWSGNYYALNCPDGTGNNCPGLPKTPGTGPNNNAQTLAEVTYQHNTIDYYDVSIINGVTNALQFGPYSSATNGSSPYYCGTAGSRAQIQNPNYNLPESTWSFSPSASNFPSVSVPLDSPSSYFALVTPSNEDTLVTCSEQSICASLLSGDTVCGWNLPNVLNGGSGVMFDPKTRVCGAFQGWATADQIWGWNHEDQTPTPIPNMAPFSFDTTFVATPMQPTVSVGNLQLCDNNTYSSYQNPPGASVNMACGGTNWTGVTTPAVTVTTVNPNWMSYVLPTILWLKQACPTCYSYPFDDQSSTFTCEKGVNSTGHNTLDYSIDISDIKNDFQ
jgi:hypothetical protein